MSELLGRKVRMIGSNRVQGEIKAVMFDEVRKERVAILQTNKSLILLRLDQLEPKPEPKPECDCPACRLKAKLENNDSRSPTLEQFFNEIINTQE